MGYFLQAAFALLFTFMVISYANSYNVNILEPYNATVPNNGSILLGKAGPGEPFYITISSTATNSSGAAINYGWNELIAYGLPHGWIATNSSLYTKQLSVEITVPPLAKNGIYQFYLKAINIGNYSRIGNVTFRAFVNVTPNVFNLTVSPSKISVGPGQPAQIYVRINNTGVSDSPFTISVSGAPAWNKSEVVIAPHSVSKYFIYNIYEEEPGVYNLNLMVNSSASPLVSKVSNINMVVKASVPNDYAALGQGAIAFPNVLAPAYSVMYLIREILKQI
ncbi:MAG: hypothetical protein ACP5TL_03380 [Candidatus Micrarchaeia archaeon]